MKPIKRGYTPHVFYTEVQTLDEAVSLLTEQQRRAKIATGNKGRRQNLKQEFGLHKGRQSAKSVTLSDRIVKGRRFQPEAFIRPAVIWTKQQVVEAYKTGSFKMEELATRGRVTATQVKYWCWPNYKPIHWRCCSSSTTCKEVCPRCGTHWKERYKIKEL